MSSFNRFGHKALTVLLTCVTLLLGAVAYAQGDPSGKVVDSNGEPIIGASVIVKGTVIGVMTDLFPWANKKQIKEAMAAKLSSMSREDADRSLRPVKTGRTRLIDWIAEEDILAKRDREYAEALAKRRI